ncbi:HTH-type transcriptional activator Btr [compost metagenome]
MVKQKGISRWQSLLKILMIISTSKELEQISNSNLEGFNNKESERLTKVFEYIHSNYMNEIKLPDIAKMANMTETSFSRFFIQRTRKSLSSFIMEIRLNSACNMLQTNNANVAEIGYLNGFNNLSNFNRQFKKYYQLSPNEYRKQFLENIK